MASRRRNAAVVPATSPRVQGLAVARPEREAFPKHENLDQVFIL